MRLLSIIVFLIATLDLVAQDYSIKGKIQDSVTNLPFELANVVLQTQDSVFVTGVATDEKGHFKIDKIKSGNYRIIVSAIGYLNNVIELRGLSKSVDLGEIILEEETELLEEVTITASNELNKSDRKVIFPNKQQLAASTNGVNLLNALQLPRLEVDIMNNKISLTTKETIQLRLNGVEVSEQEFMAVRPDDIIRIEYIENPGLRYGNAGAVLNYITRRYESGGALAMNVLQSPHRPFGNYNASSKVNYKKSEFGFNYAAQVQKFHDIIRENEETFVYEDGSRNVRKEIANPSDALYRKHSVLFNYNVQPSEKDFFNVTLGFSRYKKYDDYNNELTNTMQPVQIIQMKDWTETESNTPKIDLYWSHLFKNKQMLVLNLVGTYINSRNNRIYQEHTVENTLTDILSVVNGEKYSLIGEAIYEKEWEIGRLSGGLKHTQASIDNRYSGTVQYLNEMKEANTYAHIQFAGKVRKINYMVGVGVYRSWLKQEGTDGYETYTFRPTVSVSYTPVDRFYIRLNGSVENFSPSLGDLSMVEQYIDSLQIRRGNPELKPYKSYKLTSNSEFRFGKNSLSAWAMYTNIPDVIMEETYREEGLFIRTNENQKRIQQIMGSLTFKTRFLHDIVNLSLTGGINHFISDGHTYHYKYTNWYYRASLFANYKKWGLMYNQYSAYNTFWGEQIYGGQNGQELLLTFRHKNLNVGLGMVNPFTTTKKETINKNRYAPYYRIHSVKDASHMVVFQLSWNINFGRKYNPKQKILNNTDTNSGVMGAGR